MRADDAYEGVQSGFGLTRILYTRARKVEAQYGPDSDQIQSLGRKKKSEYAKPTRRGSTKKAPDQ